MQIPGVIADKSVVALIDSGSTHSFLDPRVISSADYSVTKTKPMLIEVANGGTMISDSICRGVNWSLQGHSFQNDFRLLEINGYDLILGLDWLEEQGPMQIDWKKMKMTFKKDNSKVELKAIQDGELKFINCHEL